MTALEIIAQTQLSIGLPSEATAAGLVASGYVGEPFAKKVIGRLEAAGFRLIPPEPHGEENNMRFDVRCSRRAAGALLDETFGHFMALPDELKRELATRIDDIFATRPTGWQLVEKTDG